MSIIRSVILLTVMVSLSYGMTDRLTILCDAGKKSCFREMFGQKASYKFKYALIVGNETVLDDGKPKKEDHKDARIRVTVKDIISDKFIIESVSASNTTSVYLSNGASLYEVCVENKREERSKIKIEISSGLDINDFANLPLQVC